MNYIFFLDFNKFIFFFVYLFKMSKFANFIFMKPTKIFDFELKFNIFETNRTNLPTLRVLFMLFALILIKLYWRFYLIFYLQIKKKILHATLMIRSWLISETLLSWLKNIYCHQVSSYFGLFYKCFGFICKFFSFSFSFSNYYFTIIIL